MKHAKEMKRSGKYFKFSKAKYKLKMKETQAKEFKISFI